MAETIAREKEKQRDKINIEKKEEGNSPLHNDKAYLIKSILRLIGEPRASPRMGRMKKKVI